MTAKSEAEMTAKSDQSPRTPTVKRGLFLIDTFLVLTTLRGPTIFSWLYIEMSKRGIRCSRRALYHALNQLMNAGYVIREGMHYAPAPTVYKFPNQFLPHLKPGIAEMDLLLLVLSGFREPRSIFLAFRGGDEHAKRVYRRAMRRLVRLGYLKRRPDGRYTLGQRTNWLLGLPIN
jgi:hypothetical protein